jgi:hypothetical protein
MVFDIPVLAVTLPTHSRCSSPRCCHLARRLWRKAGSGQGITEAQMVLVTSADKHSIWPDRVKGKGKMNKSLAIASDLEHLYVEEEKKVKKGKKKGGR